MSVWDIILPHRIFINHALRTASDELRAHIDVHKIEHEKAVEQCKADIEAAKAEKDRQFEKAKQEYLDKLSQDSIALGDFQVFVIGYVDQYLNQKFLQLTKEKTAAQSQLLYRRRSFLSEQIKLISEDITNLEERKAVLSQQADIGDIVSLIRLTGYSLQCDESDTPKSLLKKVNAAISESNDLSQVSRNALVRLRTLLQERAEYLPVIQYISWMIKQRVELRRELANERREINKEYKLLQVQVSSINSKLRFLKKSLMEQATQVRDFWAIPIANVSVRLAKLEKDLNDVYECRNGIQDEIDFMQRMHSSDSDRWNSLWEEKRSLGEKIPRFNKDRQDLYAERDQWNKRRSAVFALLKSKGVFLVSPNGRNGSDEVRVLEQERIALTRTIARKKSEHNERKLRITAEFEQKEGILNHRIGEAQKIVQEKESARLHAEKQLQQRKMQSNMPLFYVRFFESDEVAHARAVLQEAEKNKAQSERMLDGLRVALDELKTVCNKQLSDLERQYSREKDPAEQRIKDIDLGIDFIHKKGGGRLHGGQI